MKKIRISKKRCIVTSIIIVLIIILCILAFDTRIKVQTYSISSDKLSSDIRIVLITDLHSCEYGDGESELIEAIDSQKPDVIMLGGDICDDVVPDDNAEALLKGISNKYPCYYVTGNHEYWSDHIDKILNMFYTYGVEVLNGTSDTLLINGQFINICGITDPDAAYSELETDDQLKSLKNIGNNGYYTILLAHRPELIDSYAEYNFDLILCGHAHGGQWRLPGIINGLYAPNQGIFPKYAGGLYNVESSVMIVSRGLAKESTRIPRIFNRPELVVINLNSGK